MIRIGQQRAIPRPRLISEHGRQRIGDWASAAGLIAFMVVVWLLASRFPNGQRDLHVTTITTTNR